MNNENEIRLAVKCPEDCSDAELNSFELLVQTGGEVQLAGFRELLLSAFRLAFVFIEDEVVAVGAIKNPRNSYKSRIFKKAEITDSADFYQYELGWIFVGIDHRKKGYSSVIFTGLVSELNDKSCFLTTRANNIKIHKVLDKYEFTKLGENYTSSDGSYSLCLYGFLQQ